VESRFLRTDDAGSSSISMTSLATISGSSPAFALSSGSAASSAIAKERALFGWRTSAPFSTSASTCSNTVTLLMPSASAISCIVGE